MQNPIAKTSLTQIRDFLAAHDCAFAPWENADNTLGRLYATLEEKRNDEVFWTDLKLLAARLDDERFNFSVLKGSKVFGDETMDKLIDDLRASFHGGGGSGGRNVKSWLNHSVGATALLAFLLLGAATGYGQYRFVANDHDESDEPDNIAGVENRYGADIDAQVVEERLAEERMVRDHETLLDLGTLIADANVSNQVKSDLFKCLPELDAAYREALLEMFLEMDDAELAGAIEDMGRSGGVRKFIGKAKISDDDLDRFDKSRDETPTGDASDPFKGMKDACGCGDDDDDDDDDH